jgi:DNA-binding MarR family transcriptional regulator
MANLLVRMERDGLIAREAHPDDKRASLVKLTPKAKRRVPEGIASLRTVADRVVEGFSAEERIAFLALLQRAVANLSKDDAGDSDGELD